MTELTCPNCGRSGSIPEVHVNTRMLCRGCSRPFYQNMAGRFIAGEPPVAQTKSDRAATRRTTSASTGGWRDYVPEGEFPTRQAIILVAVIGLLWGGYSYMMREPEGLSDYATATTQAIARGNQSYLKGMATPETRDDLVKWTDLVRPQVESLQKQSSGGDLNVSFVVIDQNRRQRTGLVSAYLAPTAGAGDGSTAKNNASGKRIPPLELSLHYILDKWGKWRLDGRMTLLSAPKPELDKRLRRR